MLLGSAFADGLRDFAEWLEDITVSLAYSWPWLALIALIAFAVVKLNRRRREKRGGDAKTTDARRGFSIPHIGAGLRKPDKAGSESAQAVTGESESQKDKDAPAQK